MLGVSQNKRRAGSPETIISHGPRPGSFVYKMLHRGYEAWIADAQGMRFVEYGTRVDGSDAGRTVTCFIPSESGKVNILPCVVTTITLY